MMQRQGGLSVEAMCELARVSRASYYRYVRSHGEKPIGVDRRADAASEASGMDS